MMDEPLFEIAHARVRAQKDRMEECAKRGICPLCWKNLSEWHDASVTRVGDNWIITANDHPYDGAKFHFLAIYKDHVNSLNHLAPNAGDELFSLFHWLCQVWGIDGASILMRFGDMIYTGATISHLHAHIVSGAPRWAVPEPKYPDSFITSVLGYKMPKQ